MSWYVLIVTCSLTIQAVVALTALAQGWIEGSSSEPARPDHGGIAIAAYHLGRTARRRRDARIRARLQKGLR